MVSPMTNFDQQSQEAVAPASRSFWQRPAFLWSAAVLAVLILVQFVASRGKEPEVAPAPAVPAPNAPVVQEQWPDIDEPAVDPSDPQATVAEAASAGRTFIARLNLQPRMVNGQVKGFVVRPDDPSILQGTPLQSGDVLLEVDGLELDPARAASLAQNVGDYQDVFIRFERGSAEQDGMLPLGTR